MAAGDVLRVAVLAGSAGGQRGRERVLGDVVFDRGLPGSSCDIMSPFISKGDMFATISFPLSTTTLPMCGLTLNI